MSFDFAVILLFFGFGAAFVFLLLFVAKLLGPKPPPNRDKLLPYECGEIPVGPAWFNFNPRFYIIALIFVIFEVEVAFMYPVAVVFREWTAAGRGLLAFGEILVFVLVLSAGLAYVWAKGDLDWVKKLRVAPTEETAPSKSRAVGGVVASGVAEGYPAGEKP
jgi:NADH-quinone oxidoreductase subunit A